MAKTAATLTGVMGFLAVLAWVWLPALRPVFKYYGHPFDAALALLVVLGMVMWELRSGALERLAVRICPGWWRYASGMIALGILAVSAVVYPLADGLKVHGGGSDADDAMMLGGHALLAGMNPYALVTYLGNPFSPGPGWLALLAPMGWFYPMATGLALLLVVGVMIYKGRVTEANTFAVLMAGCLLVWEMAVTGNDLTAWGLLMALVLLTPLKNWRWVVGMGLVLGCLATARIAFLYVPVLYAFAYGSGLGWKDWLRSREVVVGLIGLVSACVWHGVFAAIVMMGPYPPLHLVGRAQGYAHGWVIGAAAAALTVTGIWMLVNWKKARPETHVALGFGMPMLLLAGMDLESAGSLSGWEGATYMMPALPLVLLAYVQTRKVR